MRRLQAPAVRVRRSRVHGEFPKSDRHIWLFDLDNTLHDTSHRIFAHINRGMTAAVMESLGVDEAQAAQLRTHYWQRYGATMIGLVKHHNVDAHAFLHRSHAFDVKPLLRAERGIHEKLGRLPGRKVLVTNAPLHYARNVLKHLGLLRHFHSLWSIEHFKLHGEYRPKPSNTILRHILACEGVRAHRTVLVEDTLENLRSARRVGMRTVHVYHPGTPFAGQHRGRASYVDLKVNSVSELLLRKRPVRC